MFDGIGPGRGKLVTLNWISHRPADSSEADKESILIHTMVITLGDGGL